MTGSSRIGVQELVCHEGIHYVYQKQQLKANADFVKTSTGFGTGGATLADVKLMKECVQGKAKVKASGGIRDYETAMQYVALGVERIGTSNGIAILKGEKGTGY